MAVARTPSRTDTGKNIPLRVAVFGATSAIAMATQRALLSAGSRQFFLVARNAERLETVAADLRARGATVFTAASDLDDTGAHPELIAQADAVTGGIDMALLAHGVLGEQATFAANYPATEAAFRTNLLSPVSLLTLLGNVFEKQGSGVLAVISSVAGDRGRQSNYVYGATKAGLSAFLSGMRNRLDRKGVHVLTIKPGFVATPMTAGMKLGPLVATPEKIADGIVAAVRARRDVVYLPWFWRPILFMIRSVPERIFKNLNT